MKKFRGIVIAGLMMLSLVACGSDDKAETKTTEATTAVTTEATTEATTQATTEATTQATTQAQTEATTQAQTEATTEATTAQSSGGTTDAYKDDGSVVTLTNNGDGTYSTADGKLYYLGEDGVLRARGEVDLYTTKP